MDNNRKIDSEGDDEMQCVLQEKSICDKLSELRSKALKVKADSKLRHNVNDHDIGLISENTRLLYSHQNKTIRGE